MMLIISALSYFKLYAPAKRMKMMMIPPMLVLSLVSTKQKKARNP